MGAHGFTLLIADDNPENLRVLSAMLQPEGYTVRVAPDGNRAIASMEALTPDLALLDIHMPELDGFGTFEQMKKSDTLSEVPVIFLTALNEAFHKVKAFDMGAADYICKPFEAQEVLARVALQLRLLEMRRDLKERNQSLEAANVKLHEHERFRQLFSQMLVHDMRGPLMATLGALEMLGEEVGSLDAASRLLGSAMSAARQVALMVDGVLDVARIQAGALELKREHCEVSLLAEHALQVLQGLAIGRTVRATIPEGLPRVCCDARIIERVLINMLDNALKYTPSDEAVDLAAEARPGGVRILVSDRGPGIPPEERDRIFDLFARLDKAPTRKPSTGLGLAFCKLALDAHGQQITVADRAGGGAVFSFDLPATDACEHAS
ncbi:MAG: response regulator [Myxococcales bacterium]|nr:response regulator [Myxococcales bacterium]